MHHDAILVPCARAPYWESLGASFLAIVYLGVVSEKDGSFLVFTQRDIFLFEFTLSCKI